MVSITGQRSGGCSAACSADAASCSFNATRRCTPSARAMISRRAGLDAKFARFSWRRFVRGPRRCSIVWRPSLYSKFSSSRFANISRLAGRPVGPRRLCDASSTWRGVVARLLLEWRWPISGFYIGP